jgi:rare lipoprotein A (peptidoglycan hydrolase)
MQIQTKFISHRQASEESRKRIIAALRRISAAVIIAITAIAPSYGDESELDNPPVAETAKPPDLFRRIQNGLAAFYHAAFQGRRTANGELFDHNALTAAHKTLPFGTLVRVVNLRNQRSVIVRVNDRGPMQPDRVVDLTRRAAEALGFVDQGMTRVHVEVLSQTGSQDSF